MEHMRTVGGLDGGPDLGVRLRGHAAEGRPGRWADDIGGLSAAEDFPRQGVDGSDGQELARPAGLTAARWQVLGAVLGGPLPVSGIARAMGITRQSVQRVADLLVERGLAEYRPTPAHRRAKLLAPTEEGRAAISRIDPGHAVFAQRLAEAYGAAYGEAELARAVQALERLSKVLDTLGPPVTEP
ncbi:MarR family winged helix-turn-helix transcriptional regulator [Streptomyces pimonensis]|uniref:MarR family winged helix-turn-helix transcriptional regulator n=1 Tax=Streptomyces pimonensis TaxID=2860288 RepID=UPI003526C821